VRPACALDVSLGVPPAESGAVRPACALDVSLGVPPAPWMCRSASRRRRGKWRGASRLRRDGGAARPACA